MNQGGARKCMWWESHQTGPTCPTRTTAAYTLIELVSVAALAVVLIGISVGGYHLFTRDSAVDAAQRQVMASLARARAYALARGVETCFVAINSNAFQRCFMVLDFRLSPTNDWVAFTATNTLPKYVYVDMEAIEAGTNPADETRIGFAPNGTLQWDATLYRDDFREGAYLRVNLYHQRSEDILDNPRYHRHLDISRLTGLVREVPPEKEKEDAP